MDNYKKIRSTENWWDARSINTAETVTRYRTYYDPMQRRMVTYGCVEPRTETAVNDIPQALSDEVRRTRLLLRLGKNKVSDPFSVIFSKETPKNQELIEECIEYADEFEDKNGCLIFTFY